MKNRRRRGYLSESVSKGGAGDSSTHNDDVIAAVPRSAFPLVDDGGGGGISLRRLPTLNLPQEPIAAKQKESQNGD